MVLSCHRGGREIFMLKRLSDNRNEILKYSVAALLLVIPIYPKFPVFSVPGTYVAIRAEDFLIGSIFIFWVIGFLRGRFGQFFNDTLSKSLFLFWLVGLLSILSGLLLTNSISLHLGILHFFRRIEYVIPLFIAISAIRNRRAPRFFVEVFFIASLVVFFYGLGQLYADFPVISTQNQEYSKGVALRWIPGARVHSTFAGHYDLAAFLVLFFPIAIAYLFSIRKILSRIFVFFVFIVPSFWLFLQTESRISFVSFLCGVTVTLWVIRKRLFIVPFVLVSVLSMLFLSDLGVRYRRILDVYSQKTTLNDVINIARPGSVYANEGKEDKKQPSVYSILGAQITEDRSTSIRLNVEWPRAIRAFYKNPLLGTGYSSITLATDNDYLRLLGEVGMVGTVAFLLVLLRLVAGVGVFLRRAGSIITLDVAFVGGFVGSLVGLLVNATFIDVFEASKVAIVFWVLAGIAVGIVRSKNEFSE